MKKIGSEIEPGIMQKSKTAAPAVLRSVGDDATSYKGNQQHSVIAVHNRAESIVKPF